LYTREEVLHYFKALDKSMKPPGKLTGQRSLWKKKWTVKQACAVSFSCSTWFGITILSTRPMARFNTTVMKKLTSFLHREEKIPILNFGNKLNTW